MRIIAIESLSSAASSLACLALSLTCSVGGEQRLDRLHELRRRGALLRGDEIAVEAALAVRAASGRS